MDEETLDTPHRALEMPRRAPVPAESGTESLRASGLPPARSQGRTPPRGGRYALLEELGSGGMGVVYLALDESLSRDVAVKVLRKEIADDPEARRQFREEALVLAGLEHPGAVAVHDVGTFPSGEPFYSMKRVTGSTLKELLSRRKPEEVKSRESVAHFVALYEHVCQTVAAAHSRGIVHRDLKPANVMVDDLGAVYVMDWGIALRLGADGLPERPANPGDICGTPAYMSPEQSRGEPTGRASDVFSLGTILYEILTGTNPFSSADGRNSMRRVREAEPPPPARLNGTAGRALSAICTRALAKEPSARYPSAVELAAEIQRFREFRPVEAAPPTPFERCVGWARRHPAVSSGLGAALAVVLLVAAAAGAHAASRRAMLAGASAQLSEAEDSLARAGAAVRGLEAVLASTQPPADRAHLEAELSDLKAVRQDEEERVRGVALAIIGFTALSPDPRAQEIVRNAQVATIDRHLAKGEDLAAVVALRQLVQGAEGSNLLGIAPETVAELKRKLAAAEARLRSGPGATPR